MDNQNKIEGRVYELLQQAIIIDGHSDILIPVNEGKMELGERPEVPDPATWQAPMGLEDISKILLLTRRLVERGHSDDVILKFLGGNYMRVFEQVWGE